MKKNVMVLYVLLLTSLIHAETFKFYGVWMEEERYAEYKKGEDELLVPFVKRLDGRDFLAVPNCISISMDEQTIIAPGAALKIQKVDENKIFISLANGNGRGIFYIKPINRDSMILTLEEADSVIEDNQWYFSKGESLTLHLCDSFLEPPD